jgi:8-oxo-dGTP pyrophosphatase MutT (NUDIX family)
VTGGTVSAVEAATVILVRESPTAGGPWELFMVRRPVRSEFAADVYVFPGGKVEPEDHDPRLVTLFDAPLPTAAPDGLAFRCAAIREVFEEVGVLLVTGGEIPYRGAEGRLEILLDHLRAGKMSLRDLAISVGVTLQVSGLHPFAHWITPEGMPRRYDTWFYLARLPVGQEPRHDDLETVDSLWISPHEALRQSGAGTFPLVFVTKRLLQRMTVHKSIDGLLASISATDLQVVMPREVERAEGSVFLVPGDAGY